VEGIAARLDTDIDDRTGFPAVFRARILLSLKFVDGINGSMVPASPAAITAFITLCAIQGSLLLMPSP